MLARAALAVSALWTPLPRAISAILNASAAAALACVGSVL